MKINRIVFFLILLLGFSCSSKQEASTLSAEDAARVLPGMEGTLRAFIGLARADWATAMDLMGTPEVARQWQDQEGSLFQHPLDAAAFFSQPILMMHALSHDHWIGGIYHLWLDQWLLLEFVWDKENREYRMVSYRWVQPDPVSDYMLEHDSLKAMEQALNARLQRAVDIGSAAAQDMLERKPAATPVRRGSPAGRLTGYIAHMRSALSPEGTPSLAPLREAMQQVVFAIQSGAWEERIGVVERPEALIPVYFVSSAGGSDMIVYSSYEEPLQLIVAQFGRSRDGRTVLSELTRLSLGQGWEDEP